MNFKDMWNSAAQQEKKQFTDLPAGTYKGRCLKCAFEPSKADPSKTNLVWDLQVIDGDQKNNHAFIYRSFSKTDPSEQNQKAINRVLNDFVQLDQPCDADVIGKTMESLVGKIIEFSYKPDNNNGMWKNLHRIVEAPVTIDAGDSPF